MEKIKPYILFIDVRYESGRNAWYGWKHYTTPEVAIEAFKSIRKNCSVFDEINIGKMAKIIGNGSVTYFEEN